MGGCRPSSQKPTPEKRRKMENWSCSRWSSSSHYGGLRDGSSCEGERSLTPTGRGDTACPKYGSARAKNPITNQTKQKRWGGKKRGGRPTIYGTRAKAASGAGIDDGEPVEAVAAVRGGCETGEKGGQSLLRRQKDQGRAKGNERVLRSPGGTPKNG